MTAGTVALIGMPGCGKTRIGREAARLTGRPFFDTDEYIEARYGSIADLFKQGEEIFRDVEATVILEAAKLENAVISTGGGCVLREENMAVLREKGRVVFIDRPLARIKSDIDEQIRPLIKGKTGALDELYRQRKPLYEKYADHILRNGGSLREAVQALAGYIRGVTL